MNSSITLNKMRFFAHHGVNQQEQIVGNNFEVTLKVCCDMQKAMINDELSGTIDYSKLYEVVAYEMAIPSKLLEHVAYRIITALNHKFPQISGGEISIAKLTPPFKCEIESVAISICF